MKIKTYTLNATARERLADWVYNNHKVTDAANLTLDVLRGRANHAAGACGADCVLCRPCWPTPNHHPSWALYTANDSAGDTEGRGHVELSQFETYSGRAELLPFAESDFDVTEEEDGDE